MWNQSVVVNESAELISAPPCSTSTLIKVPCWRAAGGAHTHILSDSCDLTSDSSASVNNWCHQSSGCRLTDVHSVSFWIYFISLERVCSETRFVSLRGYSSAVDDHMFYQLFIHISTTSKFIVKQPVHINNLWNTAASGSARQTVIKVSVRRFDGSNWTFLQETGWKCPDWPVFQYRNCRTLRNISN